jgi:Ca2+-binding RTX toxin-like protein
MVDSQYLQIVQGQLSRFAAQDDFGRVMDTAFGQSLDRPQLQKLRQQWLSGNFRMIPEIKVLSQHELGVANGAYAAELGCIFLSSDFMARSTPEAIAATILEEVGHHLDQLLNGGLDSAGDEGEIFRRLVYGENLTELELAGLKAQNDHAIIAVGGTAIAIEQSNINGDDGDNTLTGSTADDSIQGFGGNDTISGDTGNDTINGGNGNDTLFGQQGSDILVGGAGDDLYLFNANSDIGDDAIGEQLNQGIDSISFAPSFNGVVFDLHSTGIAQTIALNYRILSTSLAEIENLHGGLGGDILIGNSLGNSIGGGGGGDYIDGFDGNDTLDGGGNDDEIYGGGGNDQLFGDSGNDSLYGEYFDNPNALTLGDDSLDGGDGDDYLSVHAGSNTLQGGNGNDRLIGGVNNDTLVGGMGNDQYLYAIGPSSHLGIDTIVEAAGGGIDTLNFINSSAAIQLSLNSIADQSIALNVQLAALSGVEIENVIGGSAGDSIFGNGLSNRFSGGNGNDNLSGYLGNDELNGEVGDDFLSGDEGDDYLIGGVGNDYLTGGMGNDYLIGGVGNDTFDGGDSDGNDVFVINAGVDTGIKKILDPLNGGFDTLDFSSTISTAIQISLLANNTNITVATNLQIAAFSALDQIENLSGGGGNDDLSGNALNNVIHGDSGNDGLYGGNGNDILLGGSGNDFVSGDGGNDTLFGGVGNDGLYGDIGNDLLTGDGGDDVLYGKAGNDILNGGTGNDIYYIDAVHDLGLDTIIELGGTDTIDFSPYAATTTALNLNATTVQILATGVQLAASSLNQIERVLGSNSNDYFIGNALNNYLWGGSGVDRLSGGIGNDTLNGGDGTDVFAIDADVDTGTDKIEESSTGGVDVLDFRATTTRGITVNLATLTTQLVAAGVSVLLPGTIEYAYGGSLNDILLGNGFNNYLLGGAGNDSLNGGLGVDSLYGGLGNDTLVGGDGSDVFIVDADSDVGIDSIVETATGGLDILDFGTTTTKSITLNLALTTLQTVAAGIAGTNKVQLNTGGTIENATGGVLNDTLTGSSSNNILRGGQGNDSLIGANGNDVYVIDADVDTGTDTIVETATGGVDTLDFSTTTTKSIFLNLGLTGPQTVATGITVGSGVLLSMPTTAIEYAYGGTRDDSLTGNNLNNYLVGNSGNDTLSGGLGIDYLAGGLGNDRVIGGDSNDIFLIDADVDMGTDTIVETATGGVDTIDLRSTTTKGIEINLATTTLQTLALGVNLILQTVTIENAYGGSGNDYIEGNSLHNYLLGGTGTDQLVGGLGNDSLYGGTEGDFLVGNDGNDLLYGGTGNDVLDGGNGNDSFYGEDGDDVLFDLGGNNNLSGGNGNDTLNGGAGNDTLSGGAGSDRFGFNFTLGRDIITDFVVGTDKIALAVNVFAGINTLEGLFKSTAFANVLDDSQVNTRAEAIVYSRGSGNLFYNPNGTALGLGTNGGNFAVLASSLNLIASNFVVAFV